MSESEIVVTDKDLKKALMTGVLMLIFGLILVILALSVPWYNVAGFASTLGFGLGLLLLGLFAIILYFAQPERLEKIIEKRKRAKKGEKVEASKATKTSLYLITAILVIVFIIVIIAALIIAAPYL